MKPTIFRGKDKLELPAFFSLWWPYVYSILLYHDWLTRWSLVFIYKYASLKWDILHSDNDVSPVWHQAVTWAGADLLSVVQNSGSRPDWCLPMFELFTLLISCAGQTRRVLTVCCTNEVLNWTSILYRVTSNNCHTVSPMAYVRLFHCHRCQSLPEWQSEYLVSSTYFFLI